MQVRLVIWQKELLLKKFEILNVQNAETGLVGLSKDQEALLRQLIPVHVKVTKRLRKFITDFWKEKKITISSERVAPKGVTVNLEPILRPEVDLRTLTVRTEI